MIVSTARGDVEAEVVGDQGGPALVAVHGMPGDWRQLRTIGEDHCGQTVVIMPSRPGYGRTPLASGRSPDAQGDLWAALLDALGVERAVAVGVSGGGPSTVAFAARHPDRCAGLLLCCAVAIGVMPVPPAMRRLAAIPGVWSALAAVHSRRVTAEKVAAGLLDALTPTELATLDRAALQRFAHDSTTWLSGRGLRNDVRSMSRSRDRTKEVTAPTIVLHGGADAIVPLVCAEHHAASIGGATLMELPGIGHGIPLSARAELNTVIHELLARAGRLP